MIIRIPNNNIEERKYIIDIIFSEFLDLKYKLEIGSEDYEIIFNDKKIIIEDNFFNKYQKDLEYLKKENIPKNIEKLDVFSLSFFMLTRWEEHVNKNRDNHNRFPANESSAYKEGFLNRPIVNEAIEKLKEELLKVDNSLIMKDNKFEVILTHDVDFIKFWKSKKQLFRVVLGDILKRRDIPLSISRIKEYYLISKNKIKDPFDKFDWLMDISEDLGVKSRFYFMSGGTSKYDNRYDINDQKELINKIKNRGHLIGIHPSYNAYNDSKQLKKEIKVLEHVSESKIDEGREHYLRFEVPTTWQIWEDNGMRIDSSCGYPEKEGFRCGTGDEFSVFNILTRKKLKLKERPLIYMDDSSFFSQNLSEEKALDNIIKLFEGSVNMYTLLWHPNFNKDDLYLKIIKTIKEQKNG